MTRKESGEKRKKREVFPSLTFFLFSPSSWGRRSVDDHQLFFPFRPSASSYSSSIAQLPARLEADAVERVAKKEQQQRTTAADDSSSRGEGCDDGRRAKRICRVWPPLPSPTPSRITLSPVSFFLPCRDSFWTCREREFVYVQLYKRHHSCSTVNVTTLRTQGDQQRQKTAAEFPALCWPVL